MSEARVSVWTAQIRKPGMTRVASLPPTTEAFSENVKRAHLQTFIWKNALQLDQQKLDPTDYGCMGEGSRYEVTTVNNSTCGHAASAQ